MDYSALTVADYIINYVHAMKKTITNLQLQKILYFLQIKTFGESHETFFEDEIEKWKLGPVVPNVYHVYKMFGSNPISISFGGVDFEHLNHEDAKAIEQVVNELINENPFDLVERTHRHSAWSKEMEQINAGVQGIKYTKKEFEEAYSEDGAI
ncbi:Panacea domain-containing protein [Sporolactobacillus terrae]|uniref:Antitoxin SocA-like Panacea domain-containing protein n=1 Tax=Sporolactobacillus terrae TaxID=269673 RepID=A0A5K7WWW8_9BACL|nr:type II toxin-antitoxin system antitoxin SocA domain-containing protein [Sporolactobacillus terrae]BBN99181.1 hypothetical protein St703_18860 [Sporolactobacillus terrae]